MLGAGDVGAVVATLSDGGAGEGLGRLVDTGLPLTGTGSCVSRGADMEDVVRGTLIPTLTLALALTEAPIESFSSVTLPSDEGVGLDEGAVLV